MLSPISFTGFKKEILLKIHKLDIPKKVTNVSNIAAFISIKSCQIAY